MGGISNDWLSVMSPEFAKPYYKQLFDFVQAEYKTQTIFPPAKDIFNAFNYTPLANVKCVILGQDPYHNFNQAHGLCFSVLPGNDIPPSLKNIYKELHDELGCSFPNNGYLKKWADEGVLMLNTVLTVRAHTALSHQNRGWEQFTDAAISAVDRIDRPIVFMLWGRPAQKKKLLLHNPGHLVLEAAHPSPFSANSGFFGCGHFKKANEFLQAGGLEPIDWQIEDI